MKSTLFTLGAALPLAVFANVWNGVTTANDVYTMADYLLPGNWQEEAAPNGASAVANFSAISADGVFVRLPTSLTLGGANGKSGSVRPALVGDGTLVCNNGASSSGPLVQSVHLYSSLRMDMGGSQKMKLSLVEMCGNMYANPFYCSNGDTNFRADRYATSSNPVRETPWSASQWFFGSNTTTLYAPRGSAEDVTATWSLVNGSPFAVRAAGTAEHALCAGTIVTVADGSSGASLPSGTFLKRIFPDGSIELSNAATLDAASADVSLTFAAFTPRLRQHVERFRSEGTSATIRFAKYRAEDEFRVEVDGFFMDYSKYIDTPNGYVPGTLVLHNVSNPANYNFTLGNAHLEFAERKDGGTPGCPGKMSFMNSTAITTRFTVTNGITAVVGSFSGMKGTVVKDGAGTLCVGMTNDFSASAKLVVEGGTFVVSNAAGAVQSAVATLAISNGATLKLPESGFKCKAFAAELGATVEGPGFLVVPDVSATEGVNFTGGAMAVTSAQLSTPAGGYTYDTPATNVVGNPALWVDASRPETMTLVDVDGSSYKGVSRWNDVRGDGHPYLTPYGTRCPSLITNAEGVARHIWMKRVPTSEHNGTQWYWRTNTYALAFSEEIAARHVFQVINARDGGGGQFLGYDSTTYAYQQSYSGAWNSRLFNTEYKNDAVQTNIPYFLNGCRASILKGFPYPGGYNSTPAGDLLPFVMELHPVAASTTITVGNFGFVRYNSRDGNVRMYECLLYTNKLTNAEIEQVRGYLMKKWMNSEIDHDRFGGSGGKPLADIEAGDVQIASPPGKAVVVESVSGAGALAKTGAGELYVNDLVDSSRDLHVAAGRMVVRSMTVDSMPGNPCFHGDASDTGSITTNSSGKVTDWFDVRGAGYPKATSKTSATGWKPKYVSNAKNGLSGVNFGAYRTTNYYHDYAGLTLDECEDVRTAFSVMDTSQGGGFLLGNDDARSPNHVAYIVNNAKLRGLRRNPEAASKAIIYKDTYWSSSSASAQFAIAQYGPGATRGYVNGVETNLTTATFSGGWDLVALASRDPIAVTGINVGYYSSYWRDGGQILGEHVLYRETLCDENLKRAQAYLRQKWYGVSTPGYRPACVGALEVGEGAALAIYGGTPIEASALSGAGTVEGSVTFADGGTIGVEIAADGTLLLPSVTGRLAAQGGGTIVLSGAYRSLAAGTYALAAATGEWSGWTAAFADGENHNRSLAVAASGGTLWLTVVKSGYMLIVR